MNAVEVMKINRKNKAIILLWSVPLAFDTMIVALYSFQYYSVFNMCKSNRIDLNPNRLYENENVHKNSIELNRINIPMVIYLTSINVIIPINFLFHSLNMTENICLVCVILLLLKI